MKIIATRINTQGGILSDQIYNSAYPTEIRLDDSHSVKIEGGELKGIPPGEYDVDADATIYANGKSGSVRARVVSGGIELQGTCGYIEGNGSFASRVIGRLVVPKDEPVRIEVRGAADMLAGYSAEPGVLCQISLTRIEK